MTFVDNFRYYAKSETWTRLAPSKIHGIGVFAIRNIPENTNPFPDCDNLFFEMPVSDLNRFPKSVRKLALDFLYVDEDQLWVPDITLNQMNISFYLNSSSFPNCRHENGRITTLRSIKRGEELTYDYEIQA